MSDEARAAPDLPSGAYPIEPDAGEIERLRLQAAAIAFDAEVMLDRIGVGAGWRCLDLGCGAGGILELLGRRAGPAGCVVGLDGDPLLLRGARDWVRRHGLANVRLVRSDAYRTALRREAFDLVHSRFVASTAGLVDDLLREALSLVRPGGVLALQEPDVAGLNCYPAHPAWDRLKAAIHRAFDAVGAEVTLARRLYPLARRLGLEDVQYRPFIVGARSGDPWIDYFPSTVEHVRGTLLAKGILGERELDEALAACRRHLAHPDTVFTYVLVAQVWGRKPAR
jgi:SAM-dependent methyltransferase